MPSRKKKISDTVKKLQQNRIDLHKTFPNWQFTLDGRLVGDIGEAYAFAYYDLEHLEGDGRVHDFRCSDNRLVQVKITQKDTLGLGTTEPTYDYLLAFKLSEDGRISELYNGKACRVYARNGKPARKSVSLVMLEKFAKEVQSGEAIPKRKA